MPRPPPVTIATRSRRSAGTSCHPRGRPLVTEDAAPRRARARGQLGGDLLRLPTAQPFERRPLRAILGAARPARAQDQRGEPPRFGASARGGGVNVVTKFLAGHDDRVVPPDDLRLGLARSATRLSVKA